MVVFYIYQTISESTEYDVILWFILLLFQCKMFIYSKISKLCFKLYVRVELAEAGAAHTYRLTYKIVIKKKLKKKKRVT